MKASFNINISKFRKNKSVWFDDASYKDVSGSVTMTKSETDKLNGYIEEVESLAKRTRVILTKWQKTLTKRTASLSGLITKRI